MHDKKDRTRFPSLHSCPQGLILLWITLDYFMAQSLQDFIAQYTGQTGIGDTPENMGQCVGLVEKWIDNLGLVHVWGNAINLLDNADKTAYTVVLNTPTNSPSQGDIAVLGLPYGAYIDNGQQKYAGHTGIVVKADINTLTLFEQNDPGACTQKEYTYAHVLGWLHPMVLPATETVAVIPTVDQVQEQLKQEIAALDQCQNQVKKANDQITFLQASQQQAQEAIIQIQNEKGDILQKYTNDEQEIVKLTAEIASFSSERRDYAKAAQQSKDEAAQLAEYLDTIAAHLGINTKNLTDDKIANQILAAVSENEKKNSDLQNQLTRYTHVKNAISQTVSSLPSSSSGNFFKRIAKWIASGIFTQSP